MGFGIALVAGKLKQRNEGRDVNPLLESEFGSEFGSRATFIQFSSAFCTPCRATRALLTDITADLNGVKHIEVDAEKNLDLVRKLDIRSTPTTLVLNGEGVEIGRAIGRQSGLRYSLPLLQSNSCK